jgi:hypothetical protein
MPDNTLSMVVGCCPLAKAGYPLMLFNPAACCMSMPSDAGKACLVGSSLPRQGMFISRPGVKKLGAVTSYGALNTCTHTPMHYQIRTPATNQQPLI